jgi:hypothetical protein
VQFPPDDPDSDDDEFMTSALVTRKRKASVMPMSLSNSTRARQSEPVLRSGWQPTRAVSPVIIHARNPPMIDYQFMRTMATFQETGNVKFTTSSEYESISGCS